MPKPLHPGETSWGSRARNAWQEVDVARAEGGELTDELRHASAARKYIGDPAANGMCGAGFDYFWAIVIVHAARSVPVVHCTVCLKNRLEILDALQGYLEK